ncbi:MAG: NfeD-like C-terminal, partner-binding [Acidobacteriota bacterium]|nr:NfeD-like C-terminal, partner-binding [Acidobacteriota bacterium]
MRALALSLLALSMPALALLAHIVHLSRRKKSSRLPLRLVGRIASVERPLNPEGFVLIDGELWRARVRGESCVEGVRASVRVVGARGCALEVEPLVPADLHV